MFKTISFSLRKDQRAKSRVGCNSTGHNFSRRSPYEFQTRGSAKLFRQTPKGAPSFPARTDLRGGRSAMVVPTATVIRQFPQFAVPDDCEDFKSHPDAALPNVLDSKLRNIVPGALTPVLARQDSFQAARAARKELQRPALRVVGRRMHRNRAKSLCQYDNQSIPQPFTSPHARGQERFSPARPWTRSEREIDAK